MSAAKKTKPVEQMSAAKKTKPVEQMSAATAIRTNP
jgi:hypothetical protein